MLLPGEARKNGGDWFCCSPTRSDPQELPDPTGRGLARGQVLVLLGWTKVLTLVRWTYKLQTWRKVLSVQ